jgi:sugar/nucleoside kinase (ribokinase family)
VKVDVIGVGANSIDYVYRVPAHPVPDSATSKLKIVENLISPGGQTATTLCTCAALGLQTSYIGTIGNDDNGTRMRDELARRGVDVSHVIVRDATNPFAVILIDQQKGERVVMWDRQPRATLRPDDLDPSAIAGARLLHVDDVDEEAAIAAARIARAQDIPVTSDIERVTQKTEELIAQVTVPIFEEHALEVFTGEKHPERGLRKLGRDLACVTLGARGAMLISGDRVYLEPAVQVSVVDTTGAGDVFRGAFIVSMLRGDAPESILRFANRAAGLSCTRIGAIGGIEALSYMP